MNFNYDNMLKPPITIIDNASGPDDALVTLVEYGDYECPNCGQAYPIIKTIQQQMKGRLRFVFRNFPLQELHPHALVAAMATEAAAQQGAFWPMHDIIFDNQEQLSDANLIRWAGQLHLDVAAFKTAMNNDALLKKVEGDRENGIRSGVNGTPTFFINNTRYDGSWEGDHLLHALNKVHSK